MPSVYRVGNPNKQRRKSRAQREREALARVSKARWKASKYAYCRSCSTRTVHVLPHDTHRWLCAACGGR